MSEQEKEENIKTAQEAATNTETKVKGTMVSLKNRWVNGRIH